MVPEALAVLGTIPGLGMPIWERLKKSDQKTVVENEGRSPIGQV
jgi:hypothetical protein